MNNTTKAWTIGGSIIAAFFLVQFGLVFFAPLPEKPPIIDVNETKDIKNDTIKPVIIINDTKPTPKPENNTPPKPQVKNDTKDNHQRVIINDTGIFIFNFTENTTLKK